MSTAGPNATVRAMVVLPSASGLAKDNFVNTFHFHCDTLDETNLGWIRDQLASFYNDIPATLSTKVAGYISGAVNRSQPVLVKCYDLGDAKPRPLHQASFTLANPLTSSGLPNECAVTLSYFHDRSIKRQRGRIFIGPCGIGDAENATYDARPAAAMVDCLAGAANHLANQVSSAGVTWGVWSELDQVLRYPVSGGWVDNAFDTIRKRGVAPSFRKTFTAVGG